MRCDPWMDRTPIRRKTPLELAHEDRRHWFEKRKRLIAQLSEAETELHDAYERIQKLEHEAR